MHFAHLLPLKGTVLICVPNWLGDGLMSMPAVQAIRKRCGQSRILALAKRNMADLWGMQTAVDERLIYDPSPRGTMDAARAIRALHVDLALVFPNSFRSALMPYLGRVPIRVGTAGHGRSWMLTDVVHHEPQAAERHQMWEYMEIAGLARSATDPEPPRLTIPECGSLAMQGLLNARGTGPWAGLLPGAARGGSKQWPAERFVEVGQAIREGAGTGILVFGSKSEAGLCETVARGIGRRAFSLAGLTTIPELAAGLRACRVVVCNDSGGMHLAAAVGAPVVSVFGLTDPAKTGPMGTGHRVVRNESVKARRDIPRESHEAAAVLARIDSSRVIDAAMEILQP